MAREQRELLATEGSVAKVRRRQGRRLLQVLYADCKPDKPEFGQQHHGIGVSNGSRPTVKHASDYGPHQASRRRTQRDDMEAF